MTKGYELPELNGGEGKEGLPGSVTATPDGAATDAQPSAAFTAGDAAWAYDVSTDKYRKVSVRYTEGDFAVVLPEGGFLRIARLQDLRRTDPRPIEAGDRVKVPTSWGDVVFTVVAVDGDYIWLRDAEGNRVQDQIARAERV